MPKMDGPTAARVIRALPRRGCADRRADRQRHGREPRVLPCDGWSAFPIGWSRGVHEAAHAFTEKGI